MRVSGPAFGAAAFAAATFFAAPASSAPVVSLTTSIAPTIVVQGGQVTLTATFTTNETLIPGGAQEAHFTSSDGQHAIRFFPFHDNPSVVSAVFTYPVAGPYHVSVSAFFGYGYEMYDGQGNWLGTAFISIARTGEADITVTQVPVAAVAEPASLALLGIGLAGMAGLRLPPRRRRNGA